MRAWCERNFVDQGRVAFDKEAGFWSFMSILSVGVAWGRITWGNQGFPHVQNIVPTICEKRITVIVSVSATGRL